MEIFARLYQKVDINPIEVIENLLKKNSIDQNSIAVEEDGQYFIKWDEYYNHGSIEQKKEISKEKYDYIQALKFVHVYLKKY